MQCKFTQCRYLFARKFHKYQLNVVTNGMIVFEIVIKFPDLHHVCTKPLFPIYTKYCSSLNVTLVIWLLHDHSNRIWRQTSMPSGGNSVIFHIIILMKLTFLHVFSQLDASTGHILVQLFTYVIQMKGLLLYVQSSRISRERFIKYMHLGGPRRTKMLLQANTSTSVTVK